MRTTVSLGAAETRPALLHAIEQLHLESGAYWAAFSTAQFLTPIGTAWAPVDHVRHLTRSLRAVTRGLRLPGAVLWLAFGTARAPSRGYEAVRATYLAALAQGGTAGRFAPPPLGAVADGEAARARVMAHHAQAVRALITAAQAWPERALDRYRLPHPLLGKLTLREMLAFTLYHNVHHVHACARRIADEQARAPDA